MGATKKDRPLTAKERTLTLLPPLLQAEQRDRTPVALGDGPKLEEWRFDHYRHYTLYFEKRTLCGEHVSNKRIEAGCTKVCAVCRAEASRLKGIVV